VLANHDVSRAATRYGSLDRARAAALMMLSLPGAAYVYNGDELGLPDADVPRELMDDPRLRSRDPERVPLPWSGETPPYGFTTGEHTWLPMPSDWAGLTVEAQEKDPDSTLGLYRSAIRLRREFATAPFSWLEAPTDCLAYQRGDVQVLLNAGSTPLPLPAGEVLLASGPVEDVLPPDTAVWLR
jgi:alpha-glucosidase